MAGRTAPASLPSFSLTPDSLAAPLSWISSWTLPRPTIDIMSKFFKLMVAYSVLEVLRPLYNSPKILEQKHWAVNIFCTMCHKHEMLPVEYQCFIAVFLLVCPNVGKSALFNRIIASLRANQFCERLPSPNGESIVDCHQISKMPNLAFTIANKTFTLTPELYIVKLEQAGQTICINGFMAFDVPPPRGPLCYAKHICTTLKLNMKKSSGSGSVSLPRSIPELYEERGASSLREFGFQELRAATSDFSRLLKVGEVASGAFTRASSAFLAGPPAARSSRLSHSGISHLPADEVKPLVKYDNDEDAHSPGGRGRGRGGRGRGRGRGRGGRGNGFNEYADAGWEDDHARAYMGNGYARGRGRSFRGRGRRGDDDNQPEYQQVLVGIGFKGMRVTRVKNLNLYAFGLYMQPTSIREKLGPKYASFPTDKLMENPDFYSDLLRIQIFVERASRLQDSGCLQRICCFEAHMKLGSSPCYISGNGFNEYADAGWEDDHSPAYMGNGYARGRGHSFRGRGRRGGDNNQPEYQQIFTICNGTEISLSSKWKPFFSRKHLHGLSSGMLMKDDKFRLI
ncbi:Aspartic proteinase A1 [Zea mays]|uniref:Aspartic proteinase A1 n=1 Tax=Zea mays TaxID=4577 RepID=A0A1D6H628_MAIZE|nr:Aspartic proteinase A1 [Zea mays]